MEAVKEAREWLEGHVALATAEEFEEQKEILSQVAYSITSKMYESGGQAHGKPVEHDEL
jgi:heat shock protein 5